MGKIKLYKREKKKRISYCDCYIITFSDKKENRIHHIQILHNFVDIK